VDYLVGKWLHHEHDGHCDVHGEIVDASSSSEESATDATALLPPPSDDTALGSIQRRNARFMRVAAMAANETSADFTSSGAGNEGPTPSAGKPPPPNRPPVFSRDNVRFLLMIGLTGSFMIVEIAVGLSIGSLALQADAWHMVSDVLALTVGFAAARYSTSARTATATFGYLRSETLGSMVNAVFLLSTCLNITLEAIQRLGVALSGSDEADGGHGGVGVDDSSTELLMIVGGIGLAVNVLGLIIFSVGHGGGEGGSGGSHGHSHGGHGHSHGGHGHSHGGGGGGGMSMNVRAVLMHVAGDALGSVAVIIAGAIMRYTDWPHKELADPVCSLLIVVIIALGSWQLLKASAEILLHKVPHSLNVPALEHSIKSIAGVLAVHDFHVWALDPSRVIGSVHVVLDRSAPYTKVLDEVKVLLHKAGIHSSTVQPELLTDDLQKQFTAAAAAARATSDSRVDVDVSASESAKAATAATAASPSSHDSSIDGSPNLMQLLNLDMCQELVCGDNCKTSSCCPVPASPRRPAASASTGAVSGSVGSGFGRLATKAARESASEATEGPLAA
jgi:zinc transporter 1